jgi:hypothetical protein
MTNYQEEEKVRLEEALQLLTSSDPLEVYKGVHGVDPSIDYLGQTVELIDQQKLIKNCLLALGVNENTADPTLRKILEHFTITELITAYRNLEFGQDRIDLVCDLMDIIMEMDTNLACIVDYPYPQGLNLATTTATLSEAEQTYWRTSVEDLLSTSPETVQQTVDNLLANVSTIKAIVQAVGQQKFLEYCLRCYDLEVAYQTSLETLLAYFSIPQIVEAYLSFQQRMLAESRFVDLDTSHRLFWLLEHKDPKFKWAYWVKTPKYPLYDPWTNDLLNPQTGEIIPLD